METGHSTNPMMGKWLRELTERELRWLTKHHSASAIIVEWGWANQTYWLFERHSSIIRSNILGGGVVDIHGGWKYANPLMARLDWREIEHMGKVKFLDNTG